MKQTLFIIAMLMLCTSSALSQNEVVKDSTTMLNKNSNVGFTENNQKEWEYSKIKRERYLSIAKGFDIAAAIVFWSNFAVGTTLAFINNNYNYQFAIIMGAFTANGLIGAFIFNEIGRSFERRANELMVTNTFLIKDFTIGNTHLMAGLDVVNNKLSREKTLGLIVGLKF